MAKRDDARMDALEHVVLALRDVLEHGRVYMEGMSAQVDDALDRLDAALEGLDETD